MKKIGISFKDSEIELYEFLKEKLSASIYIKELIKKEMDKVEDENKNKKSNIDFDF